jgi:hypothetical protein
MKMRSTSSRRRRAVVAGSLAALTLAVMACGDTPAEPVTPAAPEPTASTPATPATTQATPVTPTPTVTSAPTVPRRTAAAQLAGFLAAARTMDTRLHRAAQLINAGISAEAVTVRPATVAAVKAADLGRARREIPAGLDRELLRRVLLVYSDLSSRRMAMDPVTHAGAGVVVLPRPSPAPAGPSAEEFLLALRNGHAAAVRFESDYAALRSLAARAPAFTEPGQRSRAAAEVDIRVAYIDGANGGCASTGGQVFTRLLPLQWQSGGDGRWTGTVNGLGFRAEYRHGGWWRVWLDAC